jgi:type II secretory pathway predicted ATPase ExeA
MYWRHFNLTAEPFSLTPDPSFLYLSPVHAEAFAAMTMGLRERRGLITMIGEVGTGKTTLVYSLLSGLGPEIHTAYISNARLSFDGILRLALRDFGVPCESTHNADLLDAFNKFLLDCATQGTTAALVIDEAQNLSHETFEDLRLLSNFETYTHKLLQIVLVGQPELDTKLRDPTLRQVAERVAVRCVVNPLTRGQARQYLEHRLAAVNGSLDLFTSTALQLLISRSRGIPRSLNILAHNAMLFAYGEESPRVVRRFVAAAVREKDGRSLIRLWRRPKAGLGLPKAPRSPRDTRSLWALGAAAFAGIAIGFLLAGTSWRSDSTNDEQMSSKTAEQETTEAPATAASAVVEPATEPDAGAVAQPELVGDPAAPTVNAPNEGAEPEPLATNDSRDAGAIQPTNAVSPPPATADVASLLEPSAEGPSHEIVAAEPPPLVAAPIPEPSVAATGAEAPTVATEVLILPAPAAAPSLVVETTAAAAEPAIAPVEVVAPSEAEPAIAAPLATAVEPPIPTPTPVVATAGPSAAPTPEVAAPSPPTRPTPAIADAPVAVRTRQPASPPPTRVRAPATPPRPVAVIAPAAPVPTIRPATSPEVELPPAPAPSVRVAARTPAPAATGAARQEPVPETGTVVTVPPGSSLSDLMLSVYGQYNSQMMNDVQAVNPQVTDPDFIVAGDRLRFPQKATGPSESAGGEAR